MDDNALDEKKNSFLKHVNDTLDGALSAGTITETEVQKCMSFILDEMGMMNSDEDLLDLIKRVNIQWNLFDNVITILSQKEFVQEDAEAINKVKDMLASFNTKSNMSEVNINTGEAIAGSRVNAAAVEINDKLKNQTEAARSASTARIKELSPAEAQVKVEQMVKDTNIRNSLVDIARLCDGTLPGPERAALIDSFSKDLSTIELFKVLQATDPVRFGALGGPANDRYIEDMLRNPNFTKKVKEKISGFLGGEKINYDEIDNLQIEVDQLQIKKIDKENEIVNNASRISHLENELDQYNRQVDPSTGEPMGAYIKQINKLKEGVISKQTNIADLERKHGVLEKYMVTGKISTGLVIEVGGKKYTLSDKATFDNFINGTQFKQLEDLISSQKVGITVDQGIIQQLEKNEADYINEKQERLSNEPKLKNEVESVNKEYDQKDKELKNKTASVKEKEKQMADTIGEILGDSYREMFIEIQSIAGEWQGEAIKTAEQLADKRLFTSLQEEFITEKPNGKKVINEKALKQAFDLMKKAKAGEGVNDFGKSRLELLYRNGMTPQSIKDHLKTIAEFDPATGAVTKILNTEKLNSLATRLTGEMLAVQVAKDPDKLKDIFTRDEAIARMMTGDVLPTLISQALKEDKYNKGVAGFEDLTKVDFKHDILGKLDKKKIGVIISILLALGLIVGAGKFIK